MTKHNVNITTGPDGTCFEVDGQDIARGLRKATIVVRPGGETEINVDIQAHFKRLAPPSSEVVVNLPDGGREALIALGWTPPAGDQ